MRITSALLIALAFTFAPTANAAVAGCIPSCEVDAADTGYTSPVTILQSGNRITWVATDITHITQDTAFGVDPCVSVVSQPGEDSDPVRFDLVAGVLHATVGTETYACASAQVTPTGAALPYHCSLHPGMRGVLVVTA